MKTTDSRSLAAAFAVAYLTISTLVGVVLIRANTPDMRVPSQAGETPTEWTVPTWDTTTTTTTTRRTTSPPTTTTTAPRGYRRVVGAYALVTVIPSGWDVKQGQVSTVSVATGGSGQEVRFGGAPPEEPAKTLYQRIETAHASKVGKNSYELITLESTMLHGYPSVRWEFSGSGGRYGAVYWEAGNIEYVIYAQSSSEQWAETSEILDQMVKHAEP